MNRSQVYLMTLMALLSRPEMPVQQTPEPQRVEQKPLEVNTGYRPSVG